MKKSNTIPFSVILSTIFIAVFCDIKTVNSIFVAGAGDVAESEGGPMALLYIVSVVGAFLSGVIFSQWKGRKISGAVPFIVVWVILFYFITVVFIAPPFTTFVFFMVLTVISFILPSITKVDGRLFLRLSMILSFPAVFRLNHIFVFQRYSDSITMGQSYAFLFPVIATIVYLFVYFKYDLFWGKVITIALTIINGVYAYYLVFFGSRGPVLAILSVILFLSVFRQPGERAGIKTLKGRFAIITSIVVIALFSFVALINLFHDVLGTYGISLEFVDKFLSLEDTGDMSNGREWIYAVSFSDIRRSPFWGMGFDQFFHNHGQTGIAYSHNFIIQILYDGGLLLFLVLVIPIWKGIKKVWKTCTTDEYAVVVALAFGSIPRALVSGDLWQNGPLWMFFGIVLCEKFVIDQNKYRIIKSKNRCYNE